MSALENARRKSTHTELLGSLTDGRRRQVLRLVGDRGDSVPVAELADHLAANAEEASAVDATRNARIQIQHAVLPHLDDVGLVDWDERDGTVTATDHPAYDDPQFQYLLETEGENWDDIVASLADERRSTVLAVLEAWGEPMEPTELASEVAVREGTGAASTETVEKLRSRLHHVHLPKLADAGLVEYDADEGLVTYDGHPDVSRTATLALSSL